MNLSAKYRPIAAMAVLLLATTTGCVQETVKEEATYYNYELWLPAMLFFGGLALAVGGYFLRSWASQFAWVLMIGGPVAALGFAPSLYLDEAKLTKEGLSHRGGIWGLTASEDVKYDDIRDIHLELEITTGRRGRKNENYYIYCETSGGQVKLSLNNDVIEMASEKFLQTAAEKGIPITKNF